MHFKGIKRNKGTEYILYNRYFIPMESAVIY